MGWGGWDGGEKDEDGGERDRVRDEGRQGERGRLGKSSIVSGE